MAIRVRTQTEDVHNGGHFLAFCLFGLAVLWPLALPGQLKLLMIPWAALCVFVLVRRISPKGRRQARVNAEMRAIKAQRQRESARAEALRRSGL